MPPSVRDARNLRTHLNLRGRPSPPSIELIVLAAQLGVALEAAILHRELGCEIPDIAERIKRASRLRRIAIEVSSR